MPMPDPANSSISINRNWSHQLSYLVDFSRFGHFSASAVHSSTQHYSVPVSIRRCLSVICRGRADYLTGYCRDWVTEFDFETRSGWCDHSASDCSGWPNFDCVGRFSILCSWSQRHFCSQARSHWNWKLTAQCCPSTDGSHSGSATLASPLQMSPVKP